MDERTERDLTDGRSVLEEDKTKKAMEYCDICLLSWNDLWPRYSCALEMDLRKSRIHSLLAELFDIDRDFVEKGIEKVEEQYRKDHDIEKAYDRFLDYLNEVAELPIYERQPDLAFLKDVQEGKYDKELAGLEQPDLGGLSNDC